MRNINTDKKIKREYYEQTYGNKLVNLDKRKNLKLKNTNYQNVWKHK